MCVCFWVSCFFCLFCHLVFLVVFALLLLFVVGYTAVGGANGY